MTVRTPQRLRREAMVRAPDAGVIVDARARQRRQRRTGVVAIAAAIAIGAPAWLAFGGGGGGARDARPAGGNRGAAAARSSGSGPASVLSSGLLAPFAYRLAVRAGGIAVIGTTAEAGGCETRVLDPRTLHVRAIIG